MTTIYLLATHILEVQFSLIFLCKTHRNLMTGLVHVFVQHTTSKLHSRQQLLSICVQHYTEWFRHSRSPLGTLDSFLLLLLLPFLPPLPGLSPGESDLQCLLPPPAVHVVEFHGHLCILHLNGRWGRGGRERERERERE